MSDIQALLSALDVFGRAPDKVSLESANTWLQDFQHSPEAWSTCNVLLLSPDAPPAAKLFAAQTFRAKVTYDLHQVDAHNLFSLRDSLIVALERYHTGPRNIVVQLCLSLSGLALQLPTWGNAVQTMIERFGRNPATVPTLLQFLTLLPEELNDNTRIPITVCRRTLFTVMMRYLTARIIKDEEYKERSAQLLTENSRQVLDLLSMYIQATGVTLAIHSQVFSCLRSWLVAGEVRATELAETQLFPYIFEALASEDLFDAAVDVVCDLIHETQELDENMPVVLLIVPRVIALKPLLLDHKDDPDKIKGYTRIFAEAGETYRLLILQHTETFFPIVEAIGDCAAYPDLDIVPITFPFWMRLAQSIGKKPSVSPLFLEAYSTLVDVIIHHLKFPPVQQATGQEAEHFRAFRHVMGDTLKDCCFVLGTDTCLLKSYRMITEGLSRSPEAVSWQEIEAPLFALRSMGAEVDPMDNSAVPKIMDLIPSLPDHPRVRYAAVLIISRYTEWINMHPEYIQRQLQYIATGFEDSDVEVSAAAGQALKFLCQDCKQHLVNFLPTLHTFLKTTGSKLQQDDRRQVYEAIAHVISAMPMEQAAESLRSFSLDILAEVHAANTEARPATAQQLSQIGDGLENLEGMLNVIRTFGERLPAACSNTCPEAWAVFDSFLSKYGTDYPSAERTTRVLRHGLTLFGDAALPVASSVLERMATGFVLTGFSSYLWIAGKLVGRFGQQEDHALRAAFLDVYERSTTKVVALLHQKSPGEIPDVLEDYLQMLLQLIDHAPDVFFHPSTFPLAFKASMAALTVIHADIVFAALDLFRGILTHESLTPPPIVTSPPNFPAYAATIVGAIEEDGFDLVGYLLSGLIGDFPEDSASAVISIFRAISVVWSAHLLACLPAVVQQLPAAAIPAQAKTQFLADVNSAIATQEYEKVKYAIIALNRVSRKNRDRRRNGAMST